MQEIRPNQVTEGFSYVMQGRIQFTSASDFVVTTGFYPRYAEFMWHQSSSSSTSALATGFWLEGGNNYSQCRFNNTRYSSSARAFLLSTNGSSIHTAGRVVSRSSTTMTIRVDEYTNNQSFAFRVFG